MPALGTRALVLRVEATDFSDSVSDVRVKVADSDSDFVSFAQAAAGGAKDFSLVMTLKQDTASTSLWYYAWNAAGTDVDVEIWPNGYNGGTVSTTYPKFTGTCTVTLPDGDILGGEANASTTAFFTSEFEWKFTAQPVIDVTP